jgi:hypothetical protein
MRNRMLAAILVLALSTTAWAAGTCAVTNVTSTQNASASVPDAGVVIVTLTCMGDASTGSFPATTVPLAGYYPTNYLNIYNLAGYMLYQVGRTPGTTQPTANYTVTVKDVQGFALDLGLLTTNGSASAAQLTAISSATAPYPVFPTVRSALTVAITANSVDSANITLDLIFRATI